MSRILKKQQLLSRIKKKQQLLMGKSVQHGHIRPL